MKNHQADPPKPKRRAQPVEAPPVATAPHCPKPGKCPAGSCRYPQPCDARTHQYAAKL